MGDTPQLNPDDQAMADSLEQALKEMSTGERRLLGGAEPPPAQRPQITKMSVERALSEDDPLRAAMMLRELLPKPPKRVYMGVEVGDVHYAAALVVLVATLRGVLRTGGDLDFVVVTLSNMRFDGMLWTLEK